MKEKAILIGLITPDLKGEQVYEYLEKKHLRRCIRDVSFHPVETDQWNST